MRDDSIDRDPPASDLNTSDVAHAIAARTPLAAAFRFVEPTWRNYIMYVGMEVREGNLDAKRYVAIWESLSKSEVRAHMPEQICELANVQAADLIGWVSRQMWAEGNAKASMCLSFTRDKVLQKTAEYAMDSPDNYKHAELYMKVSGMVPQAQRGGGTTIFNAPVASSGSVALAGGRTETGPVHPSGLRDMDHEIVELSRIMQTGNTDNRAEMREDDTEDEEDDSDKGDDDE